MFQKYITLYNGNDILISWEKGWKNLTISKNNEIYYNATSKEELEMSKVISLPNNQTIHIRLFNNELELWHNGKDLISNMTNGESNHFRNAYRTLYLIGILTISVCLLFIFLIRNDISIKNLLPSLVIGIFGLLNLILGYWTEIKEDKLPLKIGICLSCIWFLSLNIVAIGITIFIISMLYKGIKGRIISKRVNFDHLDEIPLDQF